MSEGELKKRLFPTFELESKEYILNNVLDEAKQEFPKKQDNVEVSGAYVGQRYDNAEIDEWFKKWFGAEK